VSEIPSSVKHARREKLAIAAAWLALLGPLMAVFWQQQVEYVLVDPACSRGSLLTQIGPLVGLVVLGLATRLAWQELRPRRGVAAARRGGETMDSGLRGLDMAVDPRGHDVGTEPHGDDSAPTREFLTIVGLIVAALAAILVIALWLPTLFLHPCRQ
jgi:hypothetical protein